MKEFFTQIVQMIRLTARLYYIAKLSKAMKWLKIKLPLSCQICPVIDGRLTVECPYTHITTINMYKFIKIRHDIIKQCHGNYKEMKKFNYKLDIEIFRNSTLKKLGVLRGSL